MTRTVCISRRNLVASILFIAKKKSSVIKELYFLECCVRSLRSRVMYSEGGRRREKEGNHSITAVLPFHAIEDVKAVTA